MHQTIFLKLKYRLAIEIDIVDMLKKIMQICITEVFSKTRAEHYKQNTDVIFFLSSLFPQMPRENYRSIKPYVQELCKKHDIPYSVKPTIYKAFYDVYE